jgi:hypothetical protein
MKTRAMVLLFAVIVGSGEVLVAQTDDKKVDQVPPAEKSAEQKAPESKNEGETRVESETGPVPTTPVVSATPAPRISRSQPPPNSNNEKGPTRTNRAPVVIPTNTNTSSKTATNTGTSTTDTGASERDTSGTPPATETATSTSTDTGDKGKKLPTPWPLYIFLAVISLALIGLTWLATRILKRLPATQPKLDDTELGKRINKLSLSIEGSFGLITDRLQKQSDDVTAKFAAIPSPEALHTKLAVLRQDITKLGAAVEAVARRRTDPPPKPTPAATDPIALEHQVLGETWKQFRANKELLTSFENAMQESAWEPLINDLTKTVPDDLKPTFEAVTAPWREHRMLIHKISLVPRLVNGDLKRLDNDAEELRRTREYASLLAGTQSSGEGALRLSFRFKSWVTDTFLPFADLYLQRFQQSQIEQRNSDLEAGARIVRQVLRIAAVEPIDVTLGETPFDSTRHIGRSTTNDPRFSDGVITGVVRNGFIERGQQVIRQPEVIVNRTR